VKLHSPRYGHFAINRRDAHEQRGGRKRAVAGVRSRNDISNQIRDEGLYPLKHDPSQLSQSEDALSSASLVYEMVAAALPDEKSIAKWLFLPGRTTVVTKL
jgi:hypothetical protein